MPDQFYPISSLLKIWDYQGNLLRDTVVKFKYKYDEDGDDVCEIEFESDFIGLSDRPEFQEGRGLSVQWGWTTGKVSKVRKIWIWDIKDSYKDDGMIALTLICHEKFALAKMDLVSNKNSTQVKKGVPILFSTNVIGQLALEIEQGNSDLAYLLDSGEINLKGVKSKDYGKDNVLVSYFNGNMSTFYGLRNYLDRMPGGPYVMDSRDDRVLIRTRDFKAKAKFSYSYKQENGQLLEFEPETKNRHKKKSSQKVIVTTWNHNTKEAAIVTSESGKNTGIVLANGNSLDLSSFSKALSDLNKPKLPTLSSTKGLTTIDYQSELQKAKQKHYEETVGKGGLLAKVLLSSKNPGNPNAKPGTVNDFTLEQIEDKTIVSHGQLSDGTKIDVLYLGKSSGVIRPTTGSTARDATAMASRTFGLVPDEAGSARSIMTNDDLTRAKALAENHRKNAELENHPASMKLLGEPELETGDIITIKNVSRRSSGNYYIKEVEHTIDYEGFHTHVEKAVRQGITRYNPVKGGSKDIAGNFIPGTSNFGQVNSQDFIIQDGIVVNVSKGEPNSKVTKKITLSSKTPDKK